MKTHNSKVKLLLISLGVLAQICLVLGLFITNNIVVSDSQEVALVLRPVDPRDRFRGDYLVLNYEINRVEAPSYNQKFNSGDEVYIQLDLNSPRANSKVPVGNRYNYGTIYKQKPSNPENSLNVSSQIYIKGKITSSSSQGSCNSSSCNSYNSNVIYNISYGIEQYFIPEGTGNTNTLNNSNSYGIVKINNKTGEARLDRVEIDGKRWP